MRWNAMDPETWLYAPIEIRLVRIQADELIAAQAKENDGRGIACVRTIASELAAGRFESAKAIRQAEGDKTRSYPNVEALLTQIFGCRQHGKQDCDNWLCKENKTPGIDKMLKGD